MFSAVLVIGIVLGDWVGGFIAFPFAVVLGIVAGVLLARWLGPHINRQLNDRPIDQAGVASRGMKGWLGPALLTAVALVVVWFLFHLGQVTTKWEEEVVLRSGEIVDVQRSFTQGFGDRFRWGAGALVKQTISFSRHGRRVIWRNADRRGIHESPVVLDIIADEPVLLLPVYGHAPCAKYGWPQDGIAVLRYRDGEWRTTGLSELEGGRSGLTVNLLLGFGLVRDSQHYRDRKITPKDKQTLNRDRETRHGTSIEAISQHYSEMRESCANLYPKLDEQMQAAMSRSAEAESKAETVSARLMSIGARAQPYSRERFKDEVQSVSGTGPYRGACKGVIEKTVNVSNGYHLIFVREGQRRRVPLQPVQPWGQLYGVVCSPDKVYVVTRFGAAKLLVYRLDHSGLLIDAINIHLPDVIHGKDWPLLWSIEPTGASNLVVKVANVTYPQSVDFGGTIERMATYEVTLPAETLTGVR